MLSSACASVSEHFGAAVQTPAVLSDTDCDFSQHNEANVGAVLSP